MSGLESEKHESPRQGFQSNTLGLLVMLTGVSMVLAAYVGVGRTVGMENRHILSFGLFHNIFVIPIWLLWLVGIAISVTNKDQNTRRRLSLITAFAGMLTTAVGYELAQFVIAFRLAESGELVDWWLRLGLRVSNTLLFCLWWTLLLVALFQNRLDSTSRGHNDEARTT